MDTEAVKSIRLGHATGIASLAFALIVQVLATAFFVADAVADLGVPGWAGFHRHYAFELMIALALTGGVVAMAMHLRRLLAEARRREVTVQLARGALNAIMEDKFAQWKLTQAEREVALFALKGCDIAEITALRQAASGTVRAQLSHIYSKAGVTGQAMLMSLFLEDLLDIGPALP